MTTVWSPSSCDLPIEKYIGNKVIELTKGKFSTRKFKGRSSFQNIHWSKYLVLKITRFLSYLHLIREGSVNLGSVRFSSETYNLFIIAICLTNRKYIIQTSSFVDYYIASLRILQSIVNQIKLGTYNEISHSLRIMSLLFGHSDNCLSSSPNVSTSS